jgi:putative ABC transport system permease protein
MLADFKYALRGLAKSRGFSAVAIITLALGIGANTAIFSVVEGTLLRRLPFPNADRLVRLYEAADDSGARGSTLTLSEQTFRQWREFGRDIFDDVGAATGANVTAGVVGDNPAQNIPAARISANFLSVLGLAPAVGRNFTEEEDREGGPAVAIVSHDFWRQHLDGRPDVVGSTIPIDGVSRTIIGVMPKTFRHPYRANIWLPLALPAASPTQATNHYLYGVARLRKGIDPTQGEAAVKRMCAAINQAQPDANNAHAAYLPPLRESFVMDLRPKIMVIVAASFCALFIAAANFAGLLLARVVERQGEFALRSALGAGWTRLVRQQIVQAIVLSIFGTMAGLLLASWVTPTLMAMSPEGADATGSAMREFDNAVRLDWPVFGFAAGVMLLVGLGFGFLPALYASRVDLRGAMSVTSRSATLDPRTRRLLAIFVVAQLAIAAALMIASLTAAQYFRKLVDEPWGFATDHRVAFKIAISDRLFATPAQTQQVIDATLAELQRIPGITAATATEPSPMTAPRNLIACNPEGAQPPEPRGFHLAYLRAAPPNYFKAMEHPLLQGREFSDVDLAESTPVCIISRAFARRFWPGQDPIGKRVKWGRLDGPRPWLTIVGVVGDMRVIADPRDGEVVGMVARPLTQVVAVGPALVDEITFVVVSSAKSGAIESAIRAAVKRADPRVATYEIISLEAAAAQSRVTERFIFVLVSLFSALGLVLAAVGLYGLLSLQVARRQREFGIRSALGATATQLIQLVARQGASLLGAGFMAGGIATWGIVRTIQSQWSTMPAPNVAVWILGAIVLCLAVVVACWIPARRAGRIDPVIALRAE